MEAGQIKRTWAYSLISKRACIITLREREWKQKYQIFNWWKILENQKKIEGIY